MAGWTFETGSSLSSVSSGKLSVPRRKAERPKGSPASGIHGDTPPGAVRFTRLPA